MFVRLLWRILRILRTVILYRQDFLLFTTFILKTIFISLKKKKKIRALVCVRKLPIFKIPAPSASVRRLVITFFRALKFLGNDDASPVHFLHVRTGGGYDGDVFFWPVFSIHRMCHSLVLSDKPRVLSYRLRGFTRVDDSSTWYLALLTESSSH